MDSYLQCSLFSCVQVKGIKGLRKDKSVPNYKHH